jgi:hypothetical protein
MDNVARQRTARRNGRLRVRDCVRLHYSTGTKTALVIEDRGDLGIGGRQIVRVRFGLTHVPEPKETEVAADEVTLISHAA